MGANVASNTGPNSDVASNTGQNSDELNERSRRGGREFVPRDERLIDPKPEDYERDWFTHFMEDRNLFANLIDLEYQLFTKHEAYKKAYRHYTVFATVMTMIVLICTSLVVVFEVFETNSWVSQDAARGVVAVLAFVATVFTGWLSYSGAEGKAALLKEQMKSIQGLETRVQQLTKHHVPGTINVGNAAIEIEKIKQEQLEIHRNGADSAPPSLQFEWCLTISTRAHRQVTGRRPRSDAHLQFRKVGDLYLLLRTLLLCPL